MATLIELHPGANGLEFTPTKEYEGRPVEPSLEEKIAAFNYLDGFWDGLKPSLTPEHLAVRRRHELHKSKTIDVGKTTHRVYYKDSEGKRRSVSVGPAVDDLMEVGDFILHNAPDLTEDVKEKIKDAISVLWWNNSVMRPRKRNKEPVREGLVKTMSSQLKKERGIKKDVDSPEIDAEARARVMKWRNLDLKAPRKANSGSFGRRQTKPTPPGPEESPQPQEIRPRADETIQRILTEHYEKSRNSWFEAERLRDVREKLEKERAAESAKKNAWDRAFADAIKISQPSREILVVVADRMSDLKKRAGELAIKHFNEEVSRGSIFWPPNWIRRSVWRNIYKHKVAEYAQIAERLLQEGGDIYAEIDWENERVISSEETRNLENQSAQAKIESIMNDPAIRKVPITESRQLVIDLISGVVNGQRSIDNLQGVLGNIFGSLNYFASNLVEIAAKIKKDIEDGKTTWSEAERKIDLFYMRPSWGSRQEEESSVASRIVRKAQSQPIRGVVVSPAGIGIGSSIGIIAGRWAVGAAARGGTGVPLIGAIPAGIYGGMRSKSENETDFPMHARDMFYGGILAERPKSARLWKVWNWWKYFRESGLRKRWELEGLRPETKSFIDILEEEKSFDLTNENGRRELVDHLADIQARMDFAKAYGIDLITHTHRFTVEQEKLFLEKHIQERISDLVAAGMNRVDVENQVYILLKSRKTHGFLDNLVDRQIAYSRYKLKKSVKAGVGLTAIGAGAGALAHDVTVLIGDALGANLGEPIIRFPSPIEAASAATPKPNLLPPAPDGTFWKPNGNTFDLVSVDDPSTSYIRGAYIGKDQMFHFDQANSGVEINQEMIESTDKFGGKSGVWKDLAKPYQRDWVDWGSTGVYDHAENNMRTFIRGGKLVLTLPKQADGILVTLGGSKESIYIEARNRRIIFDPSAKGFITGSGGTVVGRGELFDLLTNQKAINKLPDGEFSSERGHRNVFSIGMGGENGRIEAVKKMGARAVKVFATIQGSAPSPHQIITNQLEIAISIPPQSTPSPTPLPSPSLEPTPAPTPEPTMTPKPIPSPTPEITPRPTDTPITKPTSEVIASPTLEPTPTPSLTLTPSSPSTEPTPEPTESLTPSPSPEPTSTPSPTPSPSPTLEPTETLAATSMPSQSPEPTPSPSLEPTPTPSSSPSPSPETIIFASPSPSPSPVGEIDTIVPPSKPVSFELPALALPFYPREMPGDLQQSQRPSIESQTPETPPAPIPRPSDSFLARSSARESLQTRSAGVESSVSGSDSSRDTGEQLAATASLGEYKYLLGKQFVKTMDNNSYIFEVSRTIMIDGIPHAILKDPFGERPPIKISDLLDPSSGWKPAPEPAPEIKKGPDKRSRLRKITDGIRNRLSKGFSWIRRHVRF